MHPLPTECGRIVHRGISVKELKGQSVTCPRGGISKINVGCAFKGGYTPAYGPSMVMLSPESHEVILLHGPQWRHVVRYLECLRKNVT